MNATIRNPNAPISFGQSRTILRMLGAAYYADRDEGIVSDAAQAVSELTMGEASEIIGTQEIPASLARFVTKSAPSAAKTLKGKAAAAHVAKTPAAKKPKAPTPRKVAGFTDDHRLSRIETSISIIRETTDNTAALVTTIHEASKANADRLTAIESTMSAVVAAQEGFALILAALPQPKAA